MHGMRIVQAFCLVCGLSALCPAGQVFFDDFDSLSGWADLSLAARWGGYSGPVSAFELTDVGGVSAVSLTDEALGQTKYDNPDYLREFNCLDRRFTEPISHGESIVRIDFRARWTNEDSYPWGEGNRLVVTLTHDYPADGLDLTWEGDPGSKVRDLDQDWWARPAYNARIRGRTPASQDPGNPGRTNLLMYGGGPEDKGEFEVYSAGGQSWWLPGFSSAPGGGSPGTPGADGWVEGLIKPGASVDRFTTYRYEVTPTHQMLYMDRNDDGDFADPGELDAIQEIATPDGNPYWHYFETFEGVRIFINGRQQDPQYTDDIEIDWMRMTAAPIPEPTSLAVLLAGGLLVPRRRR